MVTTLFLDLPCSTELSVIYLGKTLVLHKNAQFVRRVATWEEIAPLMQCLRCNYKLYALIIISSN